MNRMVIIYILGPILLAVVFFGVQRFFFHTSPARTVTTDVVQGFFVGAALTFITVLLVLPQFYITKVNGWTTMYGCGEPGGSIFLRAACNVTFMGPINVQEEAMYWTTKVDGSGHALSGSHDYVLHFPAGDLPPNNAFWSLTMGNSSNQFVPNSLNRYSVSDRSGLPAEALAQAGLAQNADGSTDIYIQNTAPSGHESNWLPAPTGNFILWLRVYLPGPTILDGEYKVPPIVQVS